MNTLNPTLVTSLLKREVLLLGWVASRLNP
jgi:hypothetical protein